MLMQKLHSGLWVIALSCSVSTVRAAYGGGSGGGSHGGSSGGDGFSTQSVLTKDTCSEGDLSPSFYDGLCDTEDAAIEAVLDAVIGEPTFATQGASSTVGSKQSSVRDLIEQRNMEINAGAYGEGNFNLPSMLPKTGAHN